METDSICYSQSTVHSNEEVMRYHPGNRGNRLSDKLRNWSWVSLLIRFKVCVWLKLRSKCVRFETQHNSDGMKESLLLLNERCLSFVIIHTFDGIISMLRLSNSNTSSLIQFFILNGNILFFFFQTIWTLKFVKCSNSVGMLLRDSHQNKLRVCNWVSNPICVGSDVIPLYESERCWSDVRWEICDGSVSSCFVKLNFNTWSWDHCVTLYLCPIEWEMKKRC
jgi:hypothetical protein